MSENMPTVLPPSEAGAMEFGTFRSPEMAMKEAQMVATVFARKAEHLQLYKKIGPSKHLLIEGWQMLASMYRVTAGISGTRYIEFGTAHGFEAKAEAIYIPTGQKISSAEAMCLSDEENWGLRPKYEWRGNERVKIGEAPTPLQQLRSMAQTRACSKVLSNLLKWVARMGGFAGTPAEEMTGHESPEGNGHSVQQPQRKSEQSSSGNVISEAQAKRLYAISKGSGWSEDQVKDLLRQHGFTSSKEITRDKYDEICNALEGR